MDGVWGRRGYYEITPPGNYVACSVYPNWTMIAAGADPDQPCWTQIKHIGDDPLIDLWTPETMPHLTADQIAKRNLPHTRLYRHRIAVATTFDAWFSQVHADASLVIWREPVYRAAFATGFHEEVDLEAGGFVPKERSANPTTIQIHDELRTRAEMRAQKDFAGADIIRKVIEGGGVRIDDTPNGTFYWWPE